MTKHEYSITSKKVNFGISRNFIQFPHSKIECISLCYLIKKEHNWIQKISKKYKEKGNAMKTSLLCKVEHLK